MQHLVYSALPSAAEITNGKFPRYDFDAKNAIAEHAKTKGFKSFARVSPGWYYENHIDPEFAVIFNSFPFTADADGVYNFTMPRWGEKGHGVPWVSILEDYGDFVHGVFLNPEQYNGQFIQGFSHLGSFEDFVEGFAKRKFPCSGHLCKDTKLLTSIKTLERRPSTLPMISTRLRLTVISPLRPSRVLSMF